MNRLKCIDDAEKVQKTDADTQKDNAFFFFFLVLYLSTDNICCSACSSSLSNIPLADAPRSARALTGSGSPANKPVVGGGGCRYGVKASPVLCHYPAPSRAEGEIIIFT